MAGATSDADPAGSCALNSCCTAARTASRMAGSIPVTVLAADEVRGGVTEVSDLDGVSVVIVSGAIQSAEKDGEKTTTDKPIRTDLASCSAVSCSPD